MPTTTITTPEIIQTLRAHERELRQAGIQSLRLFGSYARGEATEASDIDILADLDPAAHMTLFELCALDRKLSELLGRPVEILPTPVESERLRAAIARDLKHVF